MKKITLNKIAVILALILSVISCNDDSYDNDTRLDGASEMFVYHTNPVTGEEYTTEELEEISYNPIFKEYYSEVQPIELSVVTDAKPLNVEIVSEESGATLATITNFSAFGDENQFKSDSYTTNVFDLGLEIGDDTKITFKVTYDNAGQDGYSDASFAQVTFTIKRVEIFIPGVEDPDYVMFLKKQNGEVIGLNSINNVEDYSSDAELGHIVTFDGISNKVEVTDIPELAFRATENFSIGVWVNATSNGGDPSIIGDKDWGSGSNDGFVFAYKGNDGWLLNIAAAGERIDIPGNVINDGNWHFLMISVDRAGDLTIYEDGTALYSVDISPLQGANISSGMPIHLAQDGTGNYGNWFDGMTGEAYIYDYALSATEAASEATLATGVRLKSETGLAKNVAVTLEGSPGVSSEEDRYTLDFDGTNFATLEEGDLGFRGASSYSISLWANATSDGGDPSIIGDKDWGSGGNKGFIFAYNGNNGWKFNAGDGDGNRVDIAGTTWNDGEWHLLTVTVDRVGESVSLYQDGELVESQSITGFGDMTSGMPIRLAQEGTGVYGHFYEGKVANTEIYDYVLTEEQVTELYNN